MASPRLSQLQRVSKKRPCPLCGRPDWCLISEDGAIGICPRTEAGAIRRCGEAGWLHRLEPSSDSNNCPRRHILALHGTRASLEEYAVRAAAHADGIAVGGLASVLGVSVESLRRLGVGWDGRAWIFPMRDHAGRVVGIRRRFPDGTKRALRGSRSGLFIPRDLEAVGTLVVAEGETDCAALLSLGFNSVGRPGCQGGVGYLAKLTHGRNVGIVRDRDEPGLSGAQRLASVLACYCPTVRIIVPHAKDAREWIAGGATRSDVMAAIDSAPVFRLRIKTRQGATT